MCRHVLPGLARLTSPSVTGSQTQLGDKAHPGPCHTVSLAGHKASWTSGQHHPTPCLPPHHLPPPFTSLPITSLASASEHPCQIRCDGDTLAQDLPFFFFTTSIPAQENRYYFTATKRLKSQAEQCTLMKSNFRNHGILVINNLATANICILQVSPLHLS